MSARARLAAFWQAEISAQGDRWALWTPVAFGGGAATEFALRSEPPFWPPLLAIIPFAIAAAVAHRWGRSRALAVAATLTAFLVGGFADAKLVTRLAAAPVVPADIGVVDVEGWVVDVASPSADKARLLIAPTGVGDLPPDRIPIRIRVTVQPEAAAEPGAAVRMRAILDPPPGPASPGGYDFARDAWFAQLGAVGLALTPPQPIAAPPPPWPLRAEMALNRFRWRLAEQIAYDLRSAGDDAGLAAAVATSHESWLPQTDEDDLRSAGLAHMLAIAGLHTAAVTGFVFAAIRLGIAAWPWLALRVPGKKLAAFGGLVAAAAYLAVSGAHPPARRAAITAAVAFLAILLDRRAISLRSLAIAALVILALQPLAVISPGFEMSFCATAALVAMAEVWPRPPGPVLAPWFIAWPQRAKDWALAMLAVSFVAGVATSPFAIQHFNRISTYGLFANLSADLVASLVLMPALAIGALGEAAHAPAVLLQPVLWVAGLGARAILAIARFFASLPGAVSTYPSAPWPALLMAYLGIVFACLWRGRLRWAAAPLAAAVLVWPRGPTPVAWIGPDGANAAIVVDGRAVALKPGVRTFPLQSWAERRGLILPFDPDAEADLAFDCNRSSCAPKFGTDPAIGAWWGRRPPREDQLDALCGSSDILILRAEIPVPSACDGSLVIDPRALEEGGAAELFPAPGGGWRIEWSEPTRGSRPWTRNAAADDQPPIEPAAADRREISDSGG